MDEALTRQQVADLLDEWVNSELMIRVVSQSDDLVAVFRGTLGARTEGKPPALFWPLHASGESDDFEQPGIYLHPERFRAAMAREGAFVIELRQAGVTLNIRRL